MWRRLEREFPDNQVKLRKILACKALLVDGRKLAVFFREERKIALGAANVTRKDHRFPPSIRRSL
jgi:hypothetical protein